MIGVDLVDEGGVVEFADGVGDVVEVVAYVVGNEKEASDRDDVAFALFEMEDAFALLVYVGVLLVLATDAVAGFVADGEELPGPDFKAVAAGEPIDEGGADFGNAHVLR